jgi:hypothetical protein
MWSSWHFHKRTCIFMWSAWHCHKRLHVKCPNFFLLKPNLNFLDMF